MSDLTHIDQDELELLTRASIYLRDKLIANKRQGPLVKLLTREIDLYSDELSARIKAEDAKLRKTPRKTG